MSSLPHVQERAPAPPAAADARLTPAAEAPTSRFARLRGVSWRHWFREVAVIAAGALAALAAQAWWSDRQDAGRERDYLRHLLADTRENEQRIASTLAADSAAGRAAGQVAAFIYGGGAIPPSDSLAGWALGAFSTQAFEPLTGTYATLLATGDLRLIRDDSLRSELVSYGARVEGVVAGLRSYNQQAFGDAGRIVRAFPFMHGIFTEDSHQLRADARRFPFVRLRRDPNAAAILFSVQVANANRRNRLRGLLEATQHLRRRFEGRRVDPEPAKTPDFTPRRPK